MRVVLQRVKEASVAVNNKICGRIGEGLLVLAAWEEFETKAEIEWMASKIINLRIFNDRNNQMNLSLKDIRGDILIVSQFTLYASTRKGNRPSYVKAAASESAQRFYLEFINLIELHLGQKPQTGIFGADMQVALTNNGPVTIIIDSKMKE